MRPITVTMLTIGLVLLLLGLRPVITKAIVRRMNGGLAPSAGRERGGNP